MTAEDEARAEAIERYSSRVIEDYDGDRYDEDEYGYDATARSAFVKGALWAASRREPSDTDEHEAALIRWLVETLHYPFDVTFAKTPPVSLDALADYWNEHDEWGVTPQEARAMIRDQAVWEEVIPDGE